MLGSVFDLIFTCKTCMCAFNLALHYFCDEKVENSVKYIIICCHDSCFLDVYKRLKVTKILKTKMFSTVRLSSVVHDGNLHTTWFRTIKFFPRGTFLQMKECTCLFRVGFLQATSVPLFSSEKWFSRCMQCSMCMCGLGVLQVDGPVRSFETCSRVYIYVNKSKKNNILSLS